LTEVLVTVTTLPLLRAPEAWPVWAVATLAMLALAVLDVVGSVLAKEWVTTGRPWQLVVGIASFVVLFYVYASSLQYAELATVTMGWIVLLQVALLLVDRFHYGVSLPPAKVCAVVAILALQGFLILGPDGGSA
jgi:multidrug transporter EmrE-like cation transporter